MSILSEAEEKSKFVVEMLEAADIPNIKVFKEFESLTEIAKIVTITDILLANGFTEIEWRKKGSCISNFFYVKEGVDTVFIVISNARTNLFSWTLIDYAVYKEFIESNERVNINGVVRHDKKLKYVINGGSFVNVPLHRLAISCEGTCVDHICHCLGINTQDSLKSVTNSQNAKNKRFYSKINKKTKTFSVSLKSIEDSDARCQLLKEGFKITEKKIISPSYSTMDALYEAVNRFENKYYGEFCYNPLIDFSDTWYAFVLYRMLGVFSEDDVREYNRDWFIRNDADVAEYYRLSA